jgi:nicotinamidase-related amidase
MEIPAKPEPITIDIERTALIVVDMQNDFAAESGMFARAGIDVTMIQNVIGPTARVIIDSAGSIKLNWTPFSKRLNVRHLIFTGCTTSVCVESTIRDAMFRDYACLLLEDCTG